MAEPILPLGFLYSLVKDAVGWVVRLVWRKPRLTNEEKIERRERWRPIFEAEVTKNWREKLRSDVIIRDVRRMDKYPDIDEKARGISPWFRVGLADTYHRGILVGFHWDELVTTPEGGWREKDFNEDGEDGEIVKVLVAGRIPYDAIETVNLDGDEFYYYPHIYCHFDTKQQPYESVGYFQEFQNPGGRPHYTEVADAKDVKKRKWRKRAWWRRLL